MVDVGDDREVAYARLIGHENPGGGGIVPTDGALLILRFRSPDPFVWTA
jgi:hypothetical protein